MTIEVEVDEPLIAFIRGRIRSSKLNARELRARAREDVTRAKAIRNIGAAQIAQDLDDEARDLTARAEEIAADARQQGELLGQLQLGQRLAVQVI